MTTCRDKIRPGIIPFFEIVRDMEPEKDVAIVRATRGFDVHSLWHNNRNTYFIRVGTQSREPSPEELGRLFQQRGSVRAELRPVSGATLPDLDRRRLQDYFSRIRQQTTPPDEDQGAWQTLLINTEIMIEEGVTVGGMLLFGMTPNRFLPHAGIDAAAFPGTQKDYAARERTALRGPMTPLLDANGSVVENGLVEQALEFVRRNTPVTAVLGNGRRIEKPAYPPDVLREAAVNALIHRDYLLSSTDIELEAISKPCTTG
jgi:ATP-dependent DNA helicase RecG